VIQAILRLKLLPDKLSGAKEIFRAMVEPIRVVPGCLGCQLYQDLLDPDVIMFEERWENQEVLDRHLRTDYYRKVLLVVEAASAPPEIRFDIVSGSNGMEIIERARRRKKR
jgi:quinol monooxygenase YgiN